MNYFKESITAIAIVLLLGFFLNGCGFTQYKNPSSSTVSSTSPGSTSGVRVIQVAAAARQAEL